MTPFRLTLFSLVPKRPWRLLQHPYPSGRADSYTAGPSRMRAPLVTFFHDTVSLCFNSALEGMGVTVRDVICDHLEKKGIPEAEISTRFDDVVRVLTETFGTSARIIVYKTMVELYKEYSIRADFTYQDSLRDRFILLKDRVIADHLVPKHAQRGLPEDGFLTPTLVQNSSPLIAASQGQSRQAVR